MEWLKGLGGPKRRSASGDLNSHNYEVVEHKVVADGVQNVAEALADLTNDFLGLIVTTGGTGFTERDLTPEGTRLVIEREAPGIAEAMRLINPLGRLSRGIAGIVGGSIIINTPGSTAGCVEVMRRSLTYYLMLCGYFTVNGCINGEYLQSSFRRRSYG